MSFKSFLGGFFISLLVGILMAQLNDLIGVLVGVIVGAFVAGTKKSGGAIGLLTAAPIAYSSTMIYSIYSLATSKISIITFGILAGGYLINIYTLIISIIGLILGIVIGYINLKIFAEEKEEKSEEVIVEV
ncbi:MAG: hypothetical protein ACP6IP_11025 [Candidatus Njordarchaeia archaeon]